jgi:succinate-semialdehyde dehydrogenase/glutarate-semialdehyde dehydrogenase
MAIQSKNPATGEVLQTFEEITDAELEKKLSKAAEAFESWKKTTIAERAKLFIKLSDYLIEHKEELGKLSTIEMGKTAATAAGGLEKSALNCQFYAENAEKFLQPEHVDTKASESYISFEPLGVILSVMPWNFPFWQVYRGAAPALMAGNVMILKHASNVPQCAIAIEESFLKAGFPQGVFQNVLLGSARVEKVIRDPRIAAITLTGSEKAGMEVAKVAGSEIKKCVLELGGSDPFIVLKDADLELAANLGCESRLSGNAGQACNAAKRFIVHESLVAEFTKKLTDNFTKVKVGDPADPATVVGPLATEQILLDLEKQVNESVAMGAKVEIGGKRVGDKGYYYEPTVLSNVTTAMPALKEEVFGPVAAVISFKTVEEAIKLANDTPYGLAATIISQDVEKAKALIPQIDAGTVFINALVRSDPRLPFGAIKKSGYGRELGSYGIKEFTNIKTIWIK